MESAAQSDLNFDIAVIQKDIKDAMAVKRINFSCHKQLKFVLQYIQHYLYFKKHGDAERQRLMQEIILGAMKNIERLESLMASLGINPVFAKATLSGDCIYKASFKHTAEKMLIDDIAAKLSSVKLLKIVAKKIRGENAKKMIDLIVLEEEANIKTLEKSFKKLRGEKFKKTIGLSDCP